MEKEQKQKLDNISRTQGYYNWEHMKVNDVETIEDAMLLGFEIGQQVKSVDLAEVVKSLFEPIDELPENRPLYKDSGLWQIRTDDMEDILYQQDVNETFDEFIKRCHAKESIWTDVDI